MNRQLTHPVLRTSRCTPPTIGCTPTLVLVGFEGYQFHDLQCGKSAEVLGCLYLADSALTDNQAMYVTKVFVEFWYHRDKVSKLPSTSLVEHFS